MLPLNGTYALIIFLVVESMNHLLALVSIIIMVFVFLYKLLVGYLSCHNQDAPQSEIFSWS